MRVLFLANHRPGRSPAQRFRFEQYLSYLESRGIECHFSWLISESDDVTFYKGSVSQKLLLASRAFKKRFLELFNGVVRNADIIFVSREALFFGPPLFEYLAYRLKKKIIFDFDDAIWLSPVSHYNQKFSWAKWPTKTDSLLRLSHLVVAGNDYLADYAKAFSENVEIIPTTINVDRYVPNSLRRSGPVRIGWSGSFSTISHFESILPALLHIKREFGEQVEFILIGDQYYSNIKLNITALPWNLMSEISDLHKFDIGLMPLPDDDWAKGKCGLKGLQYMALGIPTIMSPVGVNRGIIRDGVNGFLATTQDEWIAKLRLLVSNGDMRDKLGAAGRLTVLSDYSVHRWKDQFLNLIHSVL